MRCIQRTNVRAAVRAVLCTTLVAGAPAVADQAEQPPPTATAQPREVTRFEEIVVTAQRREQNIQDVGIAVTALDDRALQNLNITTATDIVKAVPNLRMNAYSSSQVVFNIRGVSQNDYGDQQEPPVAVYQDDSYSSSINLASFPVFDLARVETLRGPQGTLFGKNATGGAIQFISNAPTDEFEGYANFTYGSFNQVVGTARSPGRSATTCRDASPSSTTRTTAGWNPSFPGWRIAAATTTTRCAGGSPGNPATQPTWT
jgi:iron complex outermembrane receptor protein